MSRTDLILTAMSLIDLLPRFLFPTQSRGTRWLRELLRDVGVTAPLSPGCLNELVMDAANAAALARNSGDRYSSRLRKQLEARAQFIHIWTTTDQPLTQPEWAAWVAIAHKHLLPRAWIIPETTVTESRRDNSFAVPERLIVKGARGNGARQLRSVDNLPGTEILSDLKRASDKS